MSILEADKEPFKYQRIEDILNILDKVDAGEYDLSNVSNVLTTSSKTSNFEEINNFIARNNKVCYILITGYSNKAKDLILLSDEPVKVKSAQSLKDTGVILHKNWLVANDLI